jgi:dipeptidyl aminopeptidase/acylaminoacyl peptidase
VHVFSDTNIWRVDTSDAGVPPLTPPRIAVASTRTDHFPALSPDGKRLAFFSSRSGEFELWVGDSDGTNAVQLTSLKSLPGFPRWSPDGQTLTFHSDPEGHPDVLTIRADGGKPRIATPGPTTGAYPSFSRDGRFIYFTGPDAQGQNRIWKVAVSGGTPVKVTETPGDIPVESYDGSYLFYVETVPRPSALWRLQLGGGSPTKIADAVLNGAFDVAEKGVYYIDHAAAGSGVAQPQLDSRGGEMRLQYYAFATGRTVTVAANVGPTFLGLSTSRDGHTVFFPRVDASVDELMLVENFR